MKPLIATLILFVAGMFLMTVALADDPDGSAGVEIDLEAENIFGDELDLRVSGADFSSLTGSGEFQPTGGSPIPLNIDLSEISAGAMGKVRILLTDTSAELRIVIRLSGVPRIAVQDISSGEGTILAAFQLGTDELEIEIEIE